MNHNDLWDLLVSSEVIKQLERRGLLIQSENGYAITSKGYELIKKPLPISDFPEFIKEYRELFPRGIRSGGYLLKGSASGCAKKMRKFIYEHPEYSKEIILTATKNYLRRKEQDGWKFTSIAHYFIEKDGNSQLEAECENVLSGKETSAHIFTKDI